MQTAPLADLLPMILPRAVGCPNVVAEQQAKLAAIEFCEFTKAWRQVVTMTVTANPRVVLAPFGAAIHQIAEATYDGQPLRPLLAEEARLPAMGDFVPEGLPRTMTQIEAGSVILSPFQPGTLRALVYLKPSAGQAYGFDPEYPLRDACAVVDANVIKLHGDALVHGALSRILSLPRQPFTDPPMAAYCKAEFEKAKGEVQREVYRGQQGARVRVKPQWM